MSNALRLEDGQTASEQSQDFPWLQHYAEGVPQTLDVPSVPLFALLEQSAATWPDRPALRTASSVYDYASLLALVNSAASAKASRSGCLCPIARRAWSCILPFCARAVRSSITTRFMWSAI
ncbi:MAG: hypothetical protein ACK4PK_09405 [Alphaproteobacteria bacterium]